tara:strand:+ start:135 stop:524 length:390 start_codon:yes stop_codon:yes gene_type:complete
MFSHITLGTNDFPKAMAFYDTMLAPLGSLRQLTIEEYSFAACGPEEQPPQFFIGAPFDEESATAGNGTHIALLAPNRAAVGGLHDAALAEGRSDEDTPGPRPHYHEHYYGAYVRDLDGNKIQACCHTPE